MSCEAIAKVLLLDDDTIRTWYRLYEEGGIEGLTNFGYAGSTCQLSGDAFDQIEDYGAIECNNQHSRISTKIGCVFVPRS
jgi:hypothetical protein